MTPLKQQISLIPFSIEHTGIALTSDGVLKIGVVKLPWKFLTLIFAVLIIQCTKFQLSRSISFGDIRGAQNKKWELLISPDVP